MSDFLRPPWTAAHQAPPSRGFPRQEYWSGLPAFIQGIFPTQGSNLHLLPLVYWQVGSLPLAPPGSSLVTQSIKNPPTMQGTWVQSPDQEDLLEDEMATYSSILAWRIPWTEKPDELQSMGLQRAGHG